ncbi:YciI family protein [Kitasatospora sp. RB6PN24]|uniref:YciI family protein n=1 Tax=Kitasatospora humi TaxID=2893891 RepID=UPI001E487C91|nr:YciI family protein [Kitasatospora humi]MCC9310759.1 YciI family protein [Kitasatospora humi]
MFIVTLTYTAPLEAVDQLLPEHVAWLEEQYAAGTLLASGRRVPRTGGVLLARAADRAALDEVLASDPFHRARVAEYQVVEFTASMTAPGLEALREPAA